MTEKHLLLSLDDENAKALGETIANSTSRKIIKFLSEEEASENKIAKALKVPINTVEYNLQKLLKTGLIEKSKKFFWSEKGKKIDVYKVANKIIVISPKKSSLSKLKSFLPVIFISAIFSTFIWLYNKTNILTKPVVENLMQAQAEPIFSAVRDSTSEIAKIAVPYSNLGTIEYFLIGIWTVLIIFLILNLVKGGKK